MSVECPRPITVAELREMLAMYPDDAEIDFGSTMAAVKLCFYRVKSRSSDNMICQIELNEISEHDQ